MSGLTKSYPTFDCDAHVTETTGLWDFMSDDERDFVRQWFWHDGPHLIVNGRSQTFGNWGLGQMRMPSPAEASGPGVNKRILRKLWSMQLTDEQKSYVDQVGARDGRARLGDMDLQAIDQVVGIPNQMISAFLWVKNYDAAAICARAYNDQIWDWASADPTRLFPAAIVPVHRTVSAVKELHRVAKIGFKVAMIRPVDIQGRYPNQADMEPLWRAFEETGLVVAMHPLIYSNFHLGPLKQWTPGQIVARAVNPNQIGGASQTLCFAHEIMTWATQVLLSGFLERHPGITRMALMECNASWLPMLLERLDKGVQLFANERTLRVDRMPSEMFRERCFIAFEGDETPVYRQHEFFEDIGIWSSDAYHLDGTDGWSAIRAMEELEVPERVQAKLMGANARRMYGIEANESFITEEKPLPQRPEWYPTMEQIEQEYADVLVRA